LRGNALLKFEQSFEILLLRLATLFRSDSGETFRCTLGSAGGMGISPDSGLVIRSQPLQPPVHLSDTARYEPEEGLGSRRRIGEAG
jgi:hypothetical protein